VKPFLISLQFLTRIPVRIRGNVSEKEIGRSAIFFPLVGVLQGAPAAAASLLFAILFNPEIAAGLVIVVLLLINGGFHVDGLADTADAVSVKGTGDPARDRERRLSVMKDSSVGAMGAIAIALLLLLKYLFISGLLEKGLTWEVSSMILLVPVFSKWIMVPVIYHGKPARDEGLGAIFIAHGSLTVLILSSLILVVIFACTALLLPGTQWFPALKLFFVLAVPSYILSLLWVAFCRKEFGGLTGDTMGAVSEVGEILLFALAFLWI
jgi:adenosylcobinamide-GDP ribazoletransferase